MFCFVFACAFQSTVEGAWTESEGHFQEYLVNQIPMLNVLPKDKVLLEFYLRF